MSAKTCQLCGKALGRMRVGGDGDFCSREHRNQFRLRKGMDRLQEANKVASLMRRRENPKQMPLEQLLSSPVVDRRVAEVTLRVSERRTQPGPVSRACLHQASLPISSRSLFAISGRGRPAEVRETAPAGFFFSGGGRSKPVLRTRTNERFVGLLPRSSAAPLRHVMAEMPETPRECGAELGVRRRATFEGLAIGVASPRSRYLDKARNFQRVVDLAEIAFPPKMRDGGMFIRRLPRLPEAVCAVNPRPQILASPEPRSVALESSDIAVERLACEGPATEHPPRFPKLPYRVTADLLAGQRSVRLAGRVDCGSAAPQVCGGWWPVTTPSNSAWQYRPTLGSAALVQQDSLRPSKPLAISGDTYRLSEVPFTPSEWTFEYKPIALQGYLAAPKPEPVPASTLLEEDFNAGMERWTGDKADWKLDAAGARPAGLALFQPSLELADYDFEFLARIEKHGLTFVFRASDTSNYQKVTIAVADSGRYELRRSVIIGGVEEAAVVSPLGATLRPGSAFTVKTSARRNDFTISLEGEVVVHWTDGRLPAGAIGFTALRGDRARVYWVRLAPLGGPNSEAASRRLPRSIQ